MEGAAIGQAAYLNKIPYLVIRAISDKADDSAHVDYPTLKDRQSAHGKPCQPYDGMLVKKLFA